MFVGIIVMMNNNYWSWILFQYKKISIKRPVDLFCLGGGDNLSVLGHSRKFTCQRLSVQCTMLKHTCSSSQSWRLRGTLLLRCPVSPENEIFYSFTLGLCMMLVDTYTYLHTRTCMYTYIFWKSVSQTPGCGLVKGIKEILLQNVSYLYFFEFIRTWEHFFKPKLPRQFSTMS